MIKPDQSLEPDWDEDNINHIAVYGIRPEQVKISITVKDRFTREKEQNEETLFDYRWVLM